MLKWSNQHHTRTYIHTIKSNTVLFQSIKSVHLVGGYFQSPSLQAVLALSSTFIIYSNLFSTLLSRPSYLHSPKIFQYACDWKAHAISEPISSLFTVFTCLCATFSCIASTSLSPAFLLFCFWHFVRYLFN